MRWYGARSSRSPRFLINSLSMAFVEQWLRRPQNVWLRRALFQIHLWTGIGTGLYVLLVSVSGSAIVFRNELSNSPSVRPKAAVAVPKLTGVNLTHAVT